MALNITDAYLTMVVRVAFTVAEDGPVLSKWLVGRARNSDDLIEEFRLRHPEVLTVRQTGGQGIYDGDWVELDL